MSPMSPIRIQATEHSIYKVFSNDFIFTIPLYQRPYSWTTEQAGELLEDLLAFLGNGNEPIDNINPYFLGSIVLIKREQPTAEVVDGQQRLSTLTILLAALRTLVEPSTANELTKLLYEKGAILLGISDVYRLTLGSKDQNFFKEYIQDEGGISKLQNLKSGDLSDSRKNIKDNALLFVERLKEISESQRIRLAQFITQRCFLVIVSTPDLDSAYRIFSVLNDRGLDLSLTDILKAEIIGKIPDGHKGLYTEKWEDLQGKLGREKFESLFSHIRMIYKKAKLRESILKEFRQYVNLLDNPQKFINEVLCPFANSFDDIIHKNYEGEEEAQTINSLFGWLEKIDDSDWIPPAILYLSHHNNSSDKLERFFTDLERLAAGLMIQRSNINERTERYKRLLTAIENKADLYTSESPLQLTFEEKKEIVEKLNSDLYLVQKIRLFVLLRLDAALSEGAASYQYPVITVEHVLPQNPAVNSKWMKTFSVQEREKYVHRLGNLVLLSRRKNSEAKNYDFQNKKEKYFTTQTGVSQFALTTQVLQIKEWTPEVIEQRQKQLMQKLKNLWRL